MSEVERASELGPELEVCHFEGEDYASVVSTGLLARPVICGMLTILQRS